MKRLLLILLLFLATSANAALEGPRSGLVGWWKFDEGAGTTVADSSGNGNNGIIMGSPAWTTGVSGGALSFNGTTNFVRIPYSASLMQGVKTIAVWANVQDFLKRYGSFYGWGRGTGRCADNYHGWGTYNGGFSASYQNTATREVTIRPGTSIGSAGTAKLGEWAHYAFTYNMSGSDVTISLYKNGVLAGTPITASDGLSANCGMTAIGSQEDIPNPSYVRVFSGIMDDYRVYNRVLTTDEITELYKRNKPTSSDVTAPSTPKGLTATAISSSQINLSWNASADNVGVVGYIIYRGGSPIASVRGVTSYSDIAHTISSTYYYTLAPSTTYVYTVAAFDDAYNVSSQSSSASATTPSASGRKYNVSVTITGTGTSTVSSIPAGISCKSGTCTADFNDGATVVLTPYAYIRGMWLTQPPFTGWAGSGCSGKGECVFYIDSNKAVTAYYTIYPPAAAKSIGGGSVAGGKRQ